MTEIQSVQNVKAGKGEKIKTVTITMEVIKLSIGEPTRKKRKNFLEKLPEGSKLVARPSRWGNPYPVSEYGLNKSLQLYGKWLDLQIQEKPDFLKPLEGYDLVCYCDLDSPCHADLLLLKLEESNYPELTPKGGYP